MSEYNLKLLKINDNRIKLLNQMGIKTIKDLVLHFPYRFDVIEKTPLKDQEKVTIEATLIDEPKVFFKGRLSRLSFRVSYQDEEIKVTIFNRHFLKKNMTPGMTVTIMGKYHAKSHSLVASDLKLKSIADIQGITPVYSIKEGMTQKSFHNYVMKALKFYHGHIRDDVPSFLMDKHHLIHKEDALNKIHQPQLNSDVIGALRYLKYEEFFKFQLTMQYIKLSRTQNIGIQKHIDKKQIQSFIEQLPFSLTIDQNKVIQDILNDLSANKMMYRFVQGDVGSGKTVVGAVGLYANYLAGYQGAMMAPTEILALQHYQSLTKLFQNTSVQICLLTGKLSNKEKKDIYQKIENGEYDIIIGTHALFQEKLVYHQLGMVITDEQHRFGVEQRKALKEKGKQVDFLIMSATPIPRTLAISLYGDMDVSTIQSLPGGRKQIKTKYIQSTSMKPMLKDLKAYLSQGGQCYVVCPLISESEAIDSRNATDIYEAMAQYFKGHYEVGLLHGKMTDDEKNDIMEQFMNNQIQILVSTTVIEVGVDVSNANMMVIYNAERFGLSQLHQLRGRVGRGNQQGYCYLLSNATNKEAIERLKFIEQCHNGFEISQYDMKVRGPGDLLGNKQSGLPSFIVGDIFKDFNILEVARRDVQDAINNHQNDETMIRLIEEIKNNLLKNNEYVD